MIWGIGYLALGLYLLAGAPHVLHFRYPERKPGQTESEVEHSEKEKI